MKLLAKITSPDLFLKMLNELGVAFYRKLGDGYVEAVYFSSNRMVIFRGKLSSEQMEALRGQAYRVEEINLDSRRDLVEVSQWTN